MPPAAWNCSSASTSSIELIGDQKKSGSPAKTFAHSSSGLVAKISSSSAMSSAALAARACGVSKRGVGQPVGPPDGRHSGGQWRPTLQADDPEPPPVAGRVVVHARVAHRLALPDRDRMAGQQEGVEVEAHRVGALPVQRRADQLTLPVRPRATSAAHTAAGQGHARRCGRPCRRAGTAGFRPAG